MRKTFPFGFTALHQLNEEAVRGRFAVMNKNPWNGWTANARAYAKENKLKYGYRVIMAWWPRSLKATYYDSSNRWTSYHTHTGNIITKNVKEEDLAQVCNWLDYHYREEFDILASFHPLPASFHVLLSAFCSLLFPASLCACAIAFWPMLRSLGPNWPS